MLEKITTLLKTGLPKNIELAYQLSKSSQTSLWPLERGIKDLLYWAHTQPQIPTDTMLLGDLCFVLKEVIALAIHQTTLHSIPEQLYFLPNLRILAISSPSITQLPESIGTLTQLKSLSIRHTNIKSLPSSLGQLQQLTSLTLVNNPQLQELPESLLYLPALKTVRVSPHFAPLFNSKHLEVTVE